MKNIADMTTAEMVAEYNALTGKSIKKFSSREAGEKQLTAARKAISEGKKPREPLAKPAMVWKELPWEQKLGLWHSEYRCPHCGDKDNGVTPAGLEGTTAGERRSFCHVCSTEFDNETGKVYKAPVSVNRSKGISESWNDPEIAAKRAQRNAVSVEGKGSFRSTLQAFEKLGLPYSKHIKFRIALKQAGALDFQDGKKVYKFKLVKQEELNA